MLGLDFARPANERGCIVPNQSLELAVGAWGGLIMSFFGAVFAALTMYWQYQVTDLSLAVPFVVFALIGLTAAYVIRLPGHGLKPSEQTERAIMWSTIGEGVGLFLAANIVINLHRSDLLLPAMALIVGLHFFPIAFAASFRPFYVLGATLIFFAAAGFVVRAPTGGTLAGVMAGAGLWVAAAIAIRRDWRAKNHSISISNRAS